MLEKILECHLGVKNALSALVKLFWPNMSSDIRAMVLNCDVCLEHKNANQKEPLTSHLIPDRPWQVLSTDIFHWNNTNYIVLVDLYSRYFEVGRLTDLRAQTVVNKLKSYLSRHGICQTIRAAS